MNRVFAIAGLLFSTTCWAAAQADPPAVDPAVRTEQRAARDYAIIIGNESYRALPHAPYAQSDAASFREYFRRTRGMSRYRSRHVSNRTARQIRGELRRALYRVGRGGTIWVVFAGHGSSTPGGMDRALLGVRAIIDDVVDGAVDGGVPLTEVADVLSGSTKAERIIVIADAAFGGQTRDGLHLAEGETVPTPATNTHTDERITVWTAATGLSPAGAYSPADHGLFSYLVLGALRGWADGEISGQRDGMVTLTEAQHFVNWTGRQLGRTIRPSMERREEQQAWVLEQGAHLEPPPSDERIRALSLRDRTERIQAASQRIRTEATAFWPDTLEDAQAGGQAGRSALESFVQTYENATIEIALAVAVPEVQEARRLLSTWGQPEAPSTEELSVDLRCNDLASLEDKAVMGQLEDPQQDCLDNQIARQRLQTAKDKLSRILIVNARANNATAEWEELVRRHLEDIDRSDPDMCTAYAIHMFKQGDADEDVIRWADVALENKRNWSGSTYVQQVSRLLRLRAQAAYRIWQSADEDLVNDPSGEKEAVSREYRGWAMDNAREWLDYVRASGLPIRQAYDLCMAAAGNARFCSAG